MEKHDAIHFSTNIIIGTSSLQTLLKVVNKNDTMDDS